MSFNEPSITNEGAACTVSHRYKFICILIAKNASTTLRKEFGKPQYDSFEVALSAVDCDIRERYYTFAFLRNPITRLLSAYQEISWRMDRGEFARDGFRFAELEDSRERFDVFLNELEALLPDLHMRRQTDYIEGVRLDFLGIVERLHEDMTKLYGTMDMGPCPKFSRLRSRKERQVEYGYIAYNLDPEDLYLEQVQRIHEVYADDFDLYQRTYRDA